MNFSQGIQERLNFLTIYLRIDLQIFFAYLYFKAMKLFSILLMFILSTAILMSGGFIQAEATMFDNFIKHWGSLFISGQTLNEFVYYLVKISLFLNASSFSLFSRLNLLKKS
jgi:hypothetical protein